MSNDTKLLAAQARIKELRDAIEAHGHYKWCKRRAIMGMQRRGLFKDQEPPACDCLFKEALAIPDDTTELDALIADAERYRMKRLIDFKASKAINEDRWNNGYDVAVDYCINNRVPRAIAAAPVLPSVPEGWQMVPKVPTEEMYATCDNERLAQIYWRKLLAAAPSPQEEK